MKEQGCGHDGYRNIIRQFCWDSGCSQVNEVPLTNFYVKFRTWIKFLFGTDIDGLRKYINTSCHYLIALCAFVVNTSENIVACIDFSKGIHVPLTSLCLRHLKRQSRSPDLSKIVVK